MSLDRSSNGAASSGTGINPPAADLYVATTGSDTTGDGSSGNKWATVSHALAQLVAGTLGLLDKSYTIHVADGTYAEGLDFTGILGPGGYKITVAGNTTTPANVSFTGTVSYTEPLFGASTACALVRGMLGVVFSGVQFNATATAGLTAIQGARVVFDRCRSVGTTTWGVECTEHATIEFQGDCTVSGFSSVGVRGDFEAALNQTIAGTLTITGPSGGGTATGVAIARNTSFRTAASGSGFNLTISSVQTGINCGLNSSLQYRGVTGTVSLTNSSTPASSSAILGTDFGSVSVATQLTLDHWSVGVTLNSISYTESSGGRTYTNLGATSSVTQNSIYAEF